MINPSEEQRRIISLFKNQVNLRIITPAGGSKTTTALLCIKELQGTRKVLFLTYNERLKREIRSKVIEWNLLETEAHNFHAFACKAYKKSIFTDLAMKKELDNGTNFFLMKFDTLIIDEAQDINNTYYRLVSKIIKSCSISQIMLIGDPRQSIFAFNGANVDFLANPDIHFAPFKFTLFENKDTYRTNEHITEFVNHSFFKNETIHSVKKAGPKIDYWIVNPYKSEQIIYDYIREYGIDNIFILALSVKPDSKQPLPMVIDALKKKYKNSLNFFIADEKTEFDDQLAKNKISCLTFHKSKGLERKCIIVFGFDSTYDKYFNKENIREPNPLYVALTRAQEKLVLICSRDAHCYKTVSFEKSKGHLNIMPSYLNHRTIENHFSLEFESKGCKFHKKTLIKRSVCDLVKYLSTEIIEQIFKLVEFKKYPKFYMLNTDKTFKLGNISEDISPYYGSILTLLLAKENKKFNFKDFIRTQLNLLFNSQLNSTNETIKKELESYLELESNETLFKTAICLEALDGYSHKFYQILKSDNFNKEMFDSDFISKCLAKLKAEVKNPVSFEDSITLGYNHFCPHCHRDVTIDIHGRTDINSTEFVYEIKTKVQLSETDIMQAIVYSAITNKSCILFNVQTGEKINISAPRLVIHELIRLKFFTESNLKIDLIEDKSEEEDEETKEIHSNEYAGYLDLI